MIKMNTGAKMQVLENFYALDYAIFGRLNENVDVCCPILKEEYVRTKGALLSCVIDIYKNMEFAPKAIYESISAAGIQSNATARAKQSRKNATNRILNETSKKRIKNAVQESIFAVKKKMDDSVITNIIEGEIRKIGLERLTDDILIKNSLKESKNNSFLVDDKHGIAMMNAYKTLRENFIAAAISILEN